MNVWDLFKKYDCINIKIESAEEMKEMLELAKENNFKQIADLEKEFERYKKYNYQGVYAIVVDAKGNVAQKATKVSATAYLNPCRMPVYSNGKVWWTGNKTKGKDTYLFSYVVK